MVIFTAGNVPAAITFGVMENVGETAFAPKTGDATGMRMRSPENANSASIVPELIFLKYAFVGVFIIFGIVTWKPYIKGMDKLSISRSLALTRPNGRQNQIPRTLFRVIGFELALFRLRLS